LRLQDAIKFLFVELEISTVCDTDASKNEWVLLLLISHVVIFLLISNNKNTISWMNAREKKFGFTSSPVSNLSNSVKTPPCVTVHTHAVRKQTEARKFPLCSQQIELMSSG
jgi:hypothetical protein